MEGIRSQLSAFNDQLSVKISLLYEWEAYNGYINDRGFLVSYGI